MSKVRNPHLVPTGALATGFVAPSVNVEKAISIEKNIASNELLFAFDKKQVESEIIWQMQDNTVRDAEYGTLVVPSNTWAAGTTQLPFVSSSAARIVAETGKADTSDQAVNLDQITQISKQESPNQLNPTGAVVYSIVFTYKGVDFGPRTIKWSYAAEGDRNTVFNELTNNVAGMTFL